MARAGFLGSVTLNVYDVSLGLVIQFDSIRPSLYV